MGRCCDRSARRDRTIGRSNLGSAGQIQTASMRPGAREETDASVGPALRRIRARRARTIRRALGRFPRACFRRGLELGAGDGSSAALLREYAQQLICTDYYPAILDAPPRAGIEYRVLNAEEIGEAFPSRSFD